MSNTASSTALPLGSLAVPAGSQSQNLLLDSSIRDWVVLPLLLIMIMAGLLRHYLSVLLKPSGTKKIPLVEHRVKNALARASRLRSGGMGFISKEKWEGRRLYWTGTGIPGNEFEKGYLKEELDWIVEEEEEQRIEKESKKDDVAEGADDDMPNPMAMMDGMKGQFLFMIQNMVMMQGIGYFFQGYVLVKVPIPLTMGFKMMFQRGLDLTTLETSYVSSVSWYFLVMFGLRAFFRLVIEAGASGTSQQESHESLMIQADYGITMATPSGPGAKKFEAEKAIKAEIENLELTKYKGTIDDVEKRLLGTKSGYGKMINKSASSAGGEPGYDIFGVSPSPSSSRRSATTKKRQ